MNAREIIETLDEAIEDPSGLIHREKHQALAQGAHPLGKHPAYPQPDYDERLASKQWQKILQKSQQYLGVPLSKQALPVVQQKLLGAMQLIDQVEGQHAEELSKLAIELVFELPEFKSARQAYESGRIGIDAQITDDIDTSGTMTSDEPEAQAQFNQERNPEEQRWMDKMVQRRHFTNAMIHGSAVSNDFLFELAGPRLDHIHPGLRKAYGILMISTEVGYWMFPQSDVIKGAKAQTHVGISQVTFEGGEEENGEIEEPALPRPVVKARGMTFPVLIQEIIKGLTELASMPSLPRDPKDREEVINKADLVDMEAWHMILGPKLWDSFIEATDATNERELAMHLYRNIQHMDVDQFNGFMKEVLSKSPQGIQMLRQLAAKVKAEMDQDVQESELIIHELLA